MCGKSFVFVSLIFLCSCGVVCTEKPLIEKGSEFDFGLTGSWEDVLHKDRIEIARDTADPTIYQVKHEGYGNPGLHHMTAAKLTDDGAVAFLQVEIPFGAEEERYLYTLARIEDGRLRTASLNSQKLAECLKAAAIEATVENGGLFSTVWAERSDLLQVLREHYREIASSPTIWRRVAAKS